MADGKIVIDVNAKNNTGRTLSSIKEDFSGIDKTVNGVTRQTAGFNNAVGKIALGSIAAKGLEKAIGLVTQSVGGAIKRVDVLNNSNKAFSNMGFSAKETKSAMKELEKGIQGLPTPLDEAVGGLQLISAATGDVGKSSKVYTALNHAILGFGGSTEQVTNATTQLSQALSNGKIDAETWNSMIDSGMGPSLNALAKTFGMTTGEMKKGLSEGTISVEQFQDGLINLDKNGGGGLKSLTKIAKDSSSGIGTGIENAKTAVTRGVANIIESIGSKNISDAITNFGTVFENGLKKVSDVIKDVIDFVKQNKDWLLPLIGAITTFVVTFATVLQVVKTINMVKDAFVVLNAVMAANPIALVIAAIVALVAGLIWFFTQTETGREMWQNFMDWLKSAWESISTFFTGLWEGIVNIFQTVVTTISTVWNGFWDLMDTIVSTVFTIIVTTIMTYVNSIVSFWTAAWNMVATIVTTVWNVIVAGVTFAINAVVTTVLVIIGLFILAWQGIWNVIGGVVTAIWNVIVTAVTTAINFVLNTIKAILNVIAAIWSAVWNGIKTAAMFVWNLIVGFVKAEINGIKIIINAVMNAIKAVWSAVWNTIKGVATSVWNTIGNFIKGAINTVRGAIQDGINRIAHIWSGIKNLASTAWNAFTDVVNKVRTGIQNAVSAVKDKVNSMLSAGKNFVMGFVNGIAGAIGSAVKAAANMAKKALKAAKNALGIKSPSREMAEVGMFTALGMANGIDDNADRVENAMSSLADGAIHAIQDAGIADAVDSAFDVSPTLSGLANGTITAESVIRAQAGTNNAAVTNSAVNTANTVNNNFATGAFVVRNDNDIQKISEELAWHNTKSQRGGLAFG